MSLFNNVKHLLYYGKYFTTISDENTMKEVLANLSKTFNFSTSEIENRKDGVYYKFADNTKEGIIDRSIEGGFHSTGDTNVLSIHFNMKNEVEIELSFKVIIINLITQLIINKIVLLIPKIIPEIFIDIINVIMILILIIVLLFVLGVVLYNIIFKLKVIKTIKEELKEFNKIKFEEYNRLMNDSIIEQFSR